MKKIYSFLRLTILGTIITLLVTGISSAQGFQSITNLNSLTVSAITGEKPQSKVWTYAGRWWMVMPNSSGTQIWRLDGTTWTSVLNISGSTSTYADCKTVGSVTHILLYQGTSSSLVSVEYVPASNTYQLWTTRTSTVPITLDAGVETATIDMDGNGRMWLANAGTTEVNARWSDSPYSTWSSPITVATGINDDDICAVAAFNGRIGVLWSNQNTQRFGFKYHVDGADPATWSADEVPASQSALSIGGGMADDHLNMKVASDGTIYAAVKTSYNDGSTGNPQIAMLIRRPGGTWDNLYEVSTSGTRPIVVLNEFSGKVKVIYTSSESGGNILYRESSTSGISFGSVNTLMTGTYNHATSTKQNYSGDVVIMAGTGSSLASVLATDAIPGLVAHWKMDENTGTTTLADASGLSNNATTVAGDPAFVSGVEGNAMSLNGTSQYATVPDANSLDITNAITMTAWFRCDQTANTTQRILAKTIMRQGTTITGIDGYELSLSSAGKVFVRFNQQTNSDVYRLNSNASYPLNGSAWMHVAATYDGAYIRIYINGILDATGANQIFTIASNNLPLVIGRQDDPSFYTYFKGALDEVRIYNRALSLSEIQALMATTPLAPTLISPADLATGVGLTPSLSWNASQGAASYQVQVSSTANFSDIVFNQSGITATSTAVTSELSNITAYYWRVNATNAVGTGLWSQVWSFTTIGLPSIPPAPVLISPANSAYSVVVSPTVSWNASTGAASYRVQISATPDFAIPVFDQSGLTSTSTTVSPPLSNNTLYYWRVNATNTSGTSVWSPEWSFTTIASVPAVESNGAGYALDFDGTTTSTTADYVNCGTGATLNITTSSLTIEAWIKPTIQKTHSIVKKFQTSGTVGYELFLANNASPNRYVSFRLNNSATYRVNSSTNYPIDGTWMHVAATYNYSTKEMKLYVNGIQEGGTLVGPTSIGTTAQPLLIGSELPTDFTKAFQGMIDEVRVWNVARSDADIKANMTNKLVGNEAGLVGYWRFDETSGTSMNDETSNNNDGTMINMDPATDHVWSGAALGDASAYDYNATDGYSATLSHTSGDAITATTTSGTQSGIQVYRADDNSVRTGSTGLTGYSLDPSRFWGVRAIASGATVTTPSYTLVYNYSGNPAVTNEAGLKLVKRNDISVAGWTDAGATLDINANTLTVMGATGTEYALAIPTTPNPPVLVAPADNATNLSTSPLLSVTVTDPMALPLRVSFYGKAISTAGEDFTVVGFPDTQNYSASANGGTPDMFNDQTLWVKNNQVTENIVFASHVGDVIDVDSDTQWRIANTAMSTLDVGANIPYGISIGNHDATSGSSAFYNNYFGVSRFAGRDYYVGSYGSDNDNNYEIFRAGGMDFLIIHLEYDPGTSAIQWADGILKANSGRRAIVTSHSIIGTGNPGSFSTIGQAIYDELKDNSNLFLMLCGHVAGTGIRSDTYNGNTIYTLLADYQSITNGGNGYMRIMEFSPQNDLITVKTYSPHLDAWMTDADNQFTVPYNMDGNGYDLIGTNTGVVSGSTTSITWPGLSSGTEYEWYVTVSNGTSTITGPVWSFTTGGQTWLGGTVDHLTDWNTATNWSGGLVPGSETDVTITAIPGNQPVISASTAANCRNLTVASGASLTIQSTSLTSNGSLIVNGSSTGNVTYNRVMPASLYRYISSPVSSASLPSGTYWRYNEPTGEWLETTSYTPGLGYTMLANGTPVSFTGSLVTSASQTGTAPYDTPYEQNRINWGGGGWNLLGNPFTSAMSATTFISVNGVAGNHSLDPNYNAVYIYNGSTYSYIGSEIPGYSNASGTFGYNDIQVGQGFFVLANYNNVPFSFTPAMRTHNTTVPMTKSAKAEENPWPGLQLKVKYDDKENSTLVVYNEKMSAGLDPGYDVGLLSTGPDVEIYTSLLEKDNSVNFTRQALPMTDYDKNIIPVGIDSENGGEITFSAFTVPLGNYKFWLEDRVTGTFTNLNANTYTVTLPAKTYGTGRFFIIASANTPTGMEKPQVDETGIRVWTSNDQVIIKGEVSNRAICSVYDMRGQKIVETQLNDGELNAVTLPSGLHGVYLVRVVDGVKVTTGKVAIL